MGERGYSVLSLSLVSTYVLRRVQNYYYCTRRSRLFRLRRSVPLPRIRYIYISAPTVVANRSSFVNKSCIYSFVFAVFFCAFFPARPSYGSRTAKSGLLSPPFFFLRFFIYYFSPPPSLPHDDDDDDDETFCERTTRVPHDRFSLPSSSSLLLLLLLSSSSLLLF